MIWNLESKSQASWERIGQFALPISVFCLALSVLVSIYWYFRVPAPGKAIAVLGAVAVIMAIRGELKNINGREKILWILVVFSLLYVEIRAIDKDRSTAEQQQAETRAAETNNFTNIGEGIKSAINQSQKEFDATMRATNALLNKSEENIDDITGGKSFCYIHASVVEDKILLVLHTEGNSPLHDVSVDFVDLDVLKFFTESKKPFTLEAIQGFTTSFPPIPALSSNSGRILTKIPLEAKESRNFDFHFFSMNGVWEETLHLCWINSRWEEAIKVEKELKDNHKKIILIQVGKGYPRVGGKVDW